MRNHCRLDGVLEDFCDSPKASTHPLFGTHPNALQIILIFDKCELCIPLVHFVKNIKLVRQLCI